MGMYDMYMCTKPADRRTGQDRDKDSSKAQHRHRAVSSKGMVA